MPEYVRRDMVSHRAGYLTTGQFHARNWSRVRHSLAVSKVTIFRRRRN